jgi:hypothetical protein
MDLSKLREPFAAGDIEWRVQQAGEKDGKVWAKVLAYVTNRAIMVCGPENWRNEFAAAPCGGIMCGISVKVLHPAGDREWVTKWDGAENTDIEAVKGGLSGAMKRAAVQWGIGRYLYDLEEGWAKVHENGRFSAKLKEGNKWFKWDPPALPAWATPVTLRSQSGNDSSQSGKVVTPPNAAASLRKLIAECGPETKEAVEAKIAAGLTVEAARALHQTLKATLEVAGATT